MNQDFVDQTVKCKDCQNDFVFEAGEAKFYAERGFTPPKRCKPCRAANKAQRATTQGGSDPQPPQMGAPSRPVVVEAVDVQQRRPNRPKRGGGGGRWRDGGNGYDD